MAPRSPLVDGNVYIAAEPSLGEGLRMAGEHQLRTDSMTFDLINHEARAGLPGLPKAGKQQRQAAGHRVACGGELRQTSEAYHLLPALPL